LILLLEKHGFPFVAEEDSDELRKPESRALADKVVALVRRCPALAETSEHDVLRAIDKGKLDPASDVEGGQPLFWCPPEKNWIIFFC
jgi:hypothetical protein